MPAKGTHRIGEATWGALRDEYVTGNESYAKLAKRYGINLKTLQKRALNRAHPANGGKTWAEWRTEFHHRVSDETETKTVASASRTLAEVREKSARVSQLALLELEKRLTRPPDADESAPLLVETKDLVQIARLATAVKVELGGDPDGTPIEIQSKLDQLSVEQLRALAEGTDPGTT